MSPAPGEGVGAGAWKKLHSQSSLETQCLKNAPLSWKPQALVGRGEGAPIASRQLRSRGRGCESVLSPLRRPDRCPGA